MKKIQERIDEKEWDDYFRRGSGKILNTELEKIKTQAIFEMLDELAENLNLSTEYLQTEVEKQRKDLKTLTIGGVLKQLVPGKMETLTIHHEPMSKKSNERWRAEQAGYYWCIGECGFVKEVFEDYGTCDDFRYKTGNYYKTQGLAHEALDKIEALARECRTLDDNDIKYIIETVIIKKK